MALNSVVAPYLRPLMTEINWQNMVHAANKEKYSLINRKATAEREHHLKTLIDHLHIPPYDEDVRDIGKHDFHLVLLHPMLDLMLTSTIAFLLRDMLAQQRFCRKPNVAASTCAPL